MGILASSILLIALFTYTFWPNRSLVTHTLKTRFDYLEERRQTVYENLRDLNFEFKAGKYPAEDYEQQRTALEDEAATILAEMDTLR